MELCRWPSCDSGSTDGFVEKASRLDFIHVALVDIHGVARTKVFRANDAKALSENGASVEISMTAFVIDGNLGEIDAHQRHNLGNITIRPVEDTLRNFPSLGREGGARIGQVLCSAHWPDNSPIQADSRAMAVRQLQRLEDRGLHMLSGTELEFRLFPADANIRDKDLKAAHETNNMYLPRHYRQYEKFYVEMDRRMRSLGIHFTTFHTEYGHGQLEMPLKPEWGILAADNLVRMKLLTHDTASDCGYRATFMPKPLLGQTGSGFHFNHSLWREKENVMLDEKDPKKISDFTRHWIAGQLHHGPALTALFSPTVNCYRRLHTPWAPDLNDWAFDDRMTSLRVKSEAQGTYVESRGPSSASNPYLVMAGVVAAGLDGVDRKLALPAAQSKEMGSLPSSLPEALEALRKDNVLCKALGEQFVDWFLTIKQKEVELLNVVEEAKIRVEREMYFDII